MKQHSKIGAGLALAFASVLLAGCGSSDSNDNGGVNPGPGPGGTPTPPPSASVDPSVALVRQLVAQGGNNTAEPLVLSNQAFGTTNTTEPEAI